MDIIIKTRLNRLKFATFGFLVLLLVFLPVGSVFAGIGLPHAFYGTIEYMDGTPVEAGKVISAKVAGKEYGSYTIHEAGQYGDPTANDYLVVQGDIEDGAAIDFYVDGQKADQTFPFHSGWATELNLTAGAPRVPSVTYTITASAGEGGTISPSGAVTVNSGASRTFTITPNAGYVIEDILVDGHSVGAVASYTFENVTANHTIHATFGFSLSPAEVEFDVPADGSTKVGFLIYDFGGDLQVSLEDIPLRVEPQTVHVAASKEDTPVELTFYGDESFGSQTYKGKIVFLAMTGGNVAFGVKVKATVNHISADEPLPAEAAPQETSPATAEQGPSSPSRTTGWPMVAWAGIAAGAAIVITLIVVLARRRRY